MEEFLVVRHKKKGIFAYMWVGVFYVKGEGGGYRGGLEDNRRNMREFARILRGRSARGSRQMFYRLGVLFVEMGPIGVNVKSKARVVS